jgi:hypothetical protein
MSAPTVNEILIAAADLAEDQATTGQAVDALLHYFAAYPAAYGFFERSCRATHLNLRAMVSPAEIADSIRWIACRDSSADAFARWSS